MPYFRKKPVVIEAMQFDGSWHSAVPILDWIGGKDACWGDDRTIMIATLEGPHIATARDLIKRRGGALIRLNDALAALPSPPQPLVDARRPRMPSEP